MDPIGKIPLIAVVYGYGISALDHDRSVETIDVDYMDEAVAAMPWVDGIVLCGGGDVDPKRYSNIRKQAVYGIDKTRDKMEFYLVEEARKRKVPIMGICRGSQLLNIAYGGSLHQDIDSITTLKHWASNENIRLQPKSLLARNMSVREFTGTHYHHQAIDRIGQGLWPAAWSNDGIIEAVESLPGMKPYVLGVQFHPEMDFPKAAAREIFNHFIAVCTLRSTRRRLSAWTRAQRYEDKVTHTTVTEVVTDKEMSYSTDDTDAATSLLEQDWDMLDSEWYRKTQTHSWINDEEYGKPMKALGGYERAMAMDELCEFPPCRDPLSCDASDGDCLSAAIVRGTTFGKDNK